MPTTLVMVLFVKFKVVKSRAVSRFDQEEGVTQVNGLLMQSGSSWLPVNLFVRLEVMVSQGVNVVWADVEMER